MNTTRLWALLLAAALFAAACSDSDGGSASDASAPDGSSGLSVDDSTPAGELDEAPTGSAPDSDPAENSSGDDDDDDDFDESDDSEEFAEQTTTTLTTTTLPPVETMTYEGEGSDAITLDEEFISRAVAFVTHDGENEFGVRLLNADGQRVDGLADGLGPYDGSVTVNFNGQEAFRFIEIEADGAWSITIEPVDALGAPLVSGDVVEGAGDRVLAVDADEATVMVFSCADCTNTVVRSWSSTPEESQEDGNQLIEQLGSFDGRRVLPAGSAFIEILSQVGDNAPAWTLSIE